ncbi:MAG: antibiotic biosynthesis monooxygenase [Pseudolabrys sp.]
MTHVIVAYWRPKDGQTGKFLLYEQYANEQAFLDHQQTQHFKTLVLERAVPLLERRERYAYSVFD